MDAPDILVRSMSIPSQKGPSRALWQYHSRSDHHSRVACWGVLFDLLQTSGLLREHVAAGKVVFGVNHVMHDWEHQKKKKLDLVLCRPGDGRMPKSRRPHTLASLVTTWSIDLEPDQHTRLAALPEIREAPVGGVLVAMEAKATMTEHGKAGPRLYDELNSSHQIVHAASNNALSVGFFMVNAAKTFVSPDRNKSANPADRTDVTLHRQPEAAEKAIEVVRGLPRRSGTVGRGYDGLAIVVVDVVNDGRSPARLVTTAPAPERGDPFHYDAMITRIANEYDASFRAI